MNDVQINQYALTSLQEAMMDALEDDDNVRFEQLIDQRDPHLKVVADAVRENDVIRQWLHSYWERDQEILVFAERALRILTGRLSAYRIKRNAAQSYLYDDRYMLEAGGEGIRE